MANAGLLFCVHVPIPFPPDHVLVLPEEEAPVMAMDAGPLQLLIEEPAVADGKPLTLTVTLVHGEVLQVFPHLA